MPKYPYTIVNHQGIRFILIKLHASFSNETDDENRMVLLSEFKEQARLCNLDGEVALVWQVNQTIGYFPRSLIGLRSLFRAVTLDSFEFSNELECPF